MSHLENLAISLASWIHLREYSKQNKRAIRQAIVAYEQMILKEVETTYWEEIPWYELDD